MDDRAVSLLEQYEVEILRTRKGRGAILCDTDKGCLIFKEYTGSEGRISMQNQLLQYICKQGKICVEELIPNKEGALFVKDNDGTKYILKSYCEGRECNIYDKEECAMAVTLLAKLHQCTEMPMEDGMKKTIFSPAKEYEKRNKELKRVRKYLQQKGQKTAFEMNLLNHFDFFLEQAGRVAEEWNYYQGMKEKENRQRNTITFCHGDYQYHNILNSDKKWYLINFEKCIADDPIRDLHLLMRKLLEKSNWSVALGKELIETYAKENSISALQFVDLFYRLSYPEKFWKIVNFYYNSRKAWIPEKNQEKLQKVIVQEEEKRIFLEEVFQKGYMGK